MRTAHVYILRCADGSYYIGETGRSLADRVDDHQAGLGGAFTKDRRPVTLVWSQGFDRYQDAMAAERRLKGWPVDKLEALIRGKLDLQADPFLSTKPADKPVPAAAPPVTGAAAAPPVTGAAAAPPSSTGEPATASHRPPTTRPTGLSRAPDAAPAKGGQAEEFDITTYLPHLVNRTGVQFVAGFGDVLAAHDINLQMWRVLAALNHENGLRISDLAALTSIDISTLSRLLGNMEKKGLVARQRASRTDARVVTVHVTGSGKDITRAIIPVAQRYEDIALAGFAEDEVRALKKLLNRVYANLADGSIDVAA